MGIVIFESSSADYYIILTTAVVFALVTFPFHIIYSAMALTPESIGNHIEVI